MRSKYLKLSRHYQKSGPFIEHILYNLIGTDVPGISWPSIVHMIRIRMVIYGVKKEYLQNERPVTYAYRKVKAYQSI